MRFLKKCRRCREEFRPSGKYQFLCVHCIKRARGRGVKTRKLYKG